MNTATQTVNVQRFAQIPNSRVPRSKFPISKRLLTTFSASDLIPIFVEETLPGDMWDVRISILARMSTPIQAYMDNLYLDTQFFSCANRLVWTHWVNFMGEQGSPGDSITYTVPQVVSAAGGFPINGLFDHMGIPCVGQIAGANTLSVNVLPMRHYGNIYNHWYRDENLQNAYANFPAADGPDALGTYVLVQRGKRKDKFTSLLPWPQKGTTAISIPITGNALVKTSAGETFTGVQSPMKARLISGAITGVNILHGQAAGNANVVEGGATGLTVAGSGVYPTNLYADMGSISAVTINALRVAITQQQFLELDARAGTRYPEHILAHFDVISPDSRMQRPEYIGGGSTRMNFTEVPQQSATGLTGGTNPLGTLGAYGKLGTNEHAFRTTIVEHGYIIGLISLRAQITYQQGLRKHWKRSTRFDYPYPVFAGLGEQAVLNQEIYCDGSATDTAILGYEPRFEEMRNLPSEINGRFRSNSASTLDSWHSAEDFAAVPALNAAFIADSTKTTLQRNLTLGASSLTQQVLADILFEGSMVRALPAFGVPGLNRF